MQYHVFFLFSIACLPQGESMTTVHHFTATTGYTRETPPPSTCPISSPARTLQLEQCFLICILQPEVLRLG